MAPTYMDGMHTMAWMSLVGLIALACVLVVFGCLLVMDHFPASRIARLLFGPQRPDVPAIWRSEDEQKPQTILDAMRQQTPPPTFNKANYRASKAKCESRGADGDAQGAASRVTANRHAVDGSEPSDSQPSAYVFRFPSRITPLAAGRRR